MNEKDDQTMETNSETEQNEDVKEEDIEILEPESDKQKDLAHDSDEETSEEEPDNTEIDILKNEIDQLKEDKKKAEEKTLRVQAEFDNFRKRTQREKEAIQKYKAQDLASEILPTLDNFERAFQSDTSEVNEGFIEGVSMVYNQLLDALKSNGIEKMDAVDKPFDPNLHHAVMQVEDAEKESNIVVEELQTGYMLKDRVIRPAMVKVNQ